MNIKEVIQKRRSVRKFKAQSVSDDDVKEILQAASLAPTARNIQPWEFVVVKNSDTIKELSRLTSPNGTFISSAPVCIVVFSQDSKYYLEDGCAATTQALLRVASLGLGACWIAGDKKDYCEAVKKLLKVPQDFKLVSLIPVGYPDESPVAQKRDLSEMFHKESFTHKVPCL